MCAQVFNGLNRLGDVHMPSAYRVMFSILGAMKLVAFGLVICDGHNLAYHISTTVKRGRLNSCHLSYLHGHASRLECKATRL